MGDGVRGSGGGLAGAVGAATARISCFSFDRL